MSGTLIDGAGRTYEPTKPPEPQAPAPAFRTSVPPVLELERCLVSELEAQGVLVVSESSDLVGHRLKVREALERFHRWLERTTIPDPIEG